MGPEYVTFKSFSDVDLANDVIDQLKTNNIPYQVEDTSSPIDPLLIGTSSNPDIKLKLRQEDFSAASALLKNLNDRLIIQAPADYYLFDFSDKELIDILKKPDEWGPFDYQLAQKILQDRNQEFSTDQLQFLKTERIMEVAKPDDIGKSWVFLGYGLAILFAPIGIFYSYSILTAKKVLPNGRKAYAYTVTNRNQAMNMLVISSIVTILLIILELLTL